MYGTSNSSYFIKIEYNFDVKWSENKILNALISFETLNLKNISLKKLLCH